ncbi:MAG: C40 family peptidase [Methanobrevibacter sp.]|nr:C40 family peptidase [Methanobrevibacter sp.]
MMKSQELIERLIKVLDLSTYYVMGGFGARLGKDYVNYSYSYNKNHKSNIEKQYNTSPITFGFDCVCLIKAVLFWGFVGDANKEYGGAKYDGSNDITIASFKKTCAELSTDFSEGALVPGELVFIGNSHIGLYIGNGEVIESTPAWKCGVQRTLLPWRNTTNYEKLPVRAWDCHGKTSYIDYTPVSNATDWEAAYKKLSAACASAVADLNNIQQQLDKTIAALNEANAEV